MVINFLSLQINTQKIKQMVFFGFKLVRDRLQLGFRLVTD